MYDELLKSVNDVEASVIDAEISVIESLLESYEKSIMILENADSTTDTSSFDIFQEGEKWEKFKDDTNAPILGNEDESFGKRLAMVIPRLIATLIRLCKKLFSRNRNITDRMRSDVKNMRSTIQSDVPEIAHKNLQSNIETDRSTDGGKMLSIKSILFAHDTSGEIDRVFLDKGWFAKCGVELKNIFDHGTNDITDLQKHLDIISSHVKSMTRVCNDLQTRAHSGGSLIQIKDSEFVEKMDQFEKINNEDIDACNKLISFVGEKISSLQSTKSSEEDAERNQIITKILRQYNRFLKMLNTYVTSIWQAWEHDRGARDQARNSTTV